MRTWLGTQGTCDIDSCIGLMIDIYEKTPTVTPADMIKQLEPGIARTAVVAWLRHARLCNSFRDRHLRQTWYLYPTSDMQLKLSDVICDDMNDPTTMEAAAGAGIYFATHDLFKDCKERAVIIQAWIRESSSSFALKAYGVDPKTKGIDWLRLGGVLLWIPCEGRWCGVVCRSGPFSDKSGP